MWLPHEMYGYLDRGKMIAIGIHCTYTFFRIIYVNVLKLHIIWYYCSSSHDHCVFFNDHRLGVMTSVLTLSEVGHRYESLLEQDKYCGIWCLTATQATLRHISNDVLAQSQANVATMLFIIQLKKNNKNSSKITKIVTPVTFPNKSSNI